MSCKEDLKKWLENKPSSIIKYPDKILRSVAKSIDIFDDETTKLLKDITNEMFNTMYTYNGVGLAAPQVGLPYKIIVCNATGNWTNGAEERVFINPEFISQSNLQKCEDIEGCLSLPEINSKIIRPKRFMFSACSIAGVKDKFAYVGRLSRILQHEIDHLNGILIIDKMKQEDLQVINHILVDLDNNHVPLTLWD